MVALATSCIQRLDIPGSIAELGVYRGALSQVLHALAPERRLYLFDTFEGFPNAGSDSRFRDTSLDFVKRVVGDSPNIIFRKGVFPETAIGLEGEVFAFVMLDADRFEATYAGLEFFYPRLGRGGYLFVHDYNSPESDWGVSRAVNQFMADKPEWLIELPDPWGSAVIRKV